MHCRPSQVLDLARTHGAYAVYCFDSAVVRWGTAFDAAISEAAEKAKNPQAGVAAQMRVLRRWVDVGAAGYRDPAHS